MIIKEEGLEAFADHASSDSGQNRDDLAQDDDDDPDYQVGFTDPSFIVCLFCYLICLFFLCLCFCYVQNLTYIRYIV